MAMTLEEIGALLQAEEIKYEQRGLSKLLFGLRTKLYRSPAGKDGIFLVIELAEDGEYFKLYAPQAFTATGPHVDVFLKACMVVQWMTKLIQFEYDPSDGEIRPIIEFPLEDNKLTQRQLMRCIVGFVTIVEEHYQPLKQALDEGVSHRAGAPDRAMEILASLTAVREPQ